MLPSLGMKTSLNMSSKIIRLTVQNLLRIQAAEVTPDGALVIVAGRNDQGKSSLLNCIGIALSGKNLPEEPIRKGETRGHVILETEQFVITRKFSQSGGGQLIVHDREGQPVTQPQTKLDALYNLTTFDPLTFTRQKPADQAATLRTLTGLDFSAEQARHAELFSRRTEVGRDVQLQKGRMSTIARNPDVPAKPIDLAELTERLNAAIESNTSLDRLRAQLSDENDAVDEAEMTVKDAEKRLQAARARLTNVTAERDALKKRVESSAEVDTALLTQELSQANVTNLAIRENARWSEEHRQLTALESRYAALTEELSRIAEDRNKRTREAKFPVDGLGFDDAGNVTFEGHPFSQVSSSKQIRVSLAIACALNPNLRVMLIRDGSLLDADSLKLVREFAEQHNAQVFLECVGHREDATVIIEDGQVSETPVATRKAKTKT
jgi:DNA repair exonuclease SbcCD ATPase subunit